MNIPKLSLHPSFHLAKVQPMLESDEIIGCGVTGELRQLYLGEPVGITGICNKNEYCGSSYTKDLTILCDLCGAYKDVLQLEMSKYKNVNADTISLGTFSDVLDIENSDDDSSDKLDEASQSEKRTVLVQNVEEKTQQDDSKEQSQTSLRRSVLNFVQENKKTLFCLGGIALLNAGILAYKHFSEMVANGGDN